MTTREPTGRRSRTSLAALAAGVTLAGILLHSKLKLTAGLPRSAYAVPEEPREEPGDDARRAPRYEEAPGPDADGEAARAGEDAAWPDEGAEGAPEPAAGAGSDGEPG